jgi:hypothetical protein
MFEMSHYIGERLALIKRRARKGNEQEESVYWQAYYAHNTKAPASPPLGRKLT